MERMSTEFGGLSATNMSIRWSVIREICVIRDNPRFGDFSFHCYGCGDVNIAAISSGN